MVEKRVQAYKNALQVLFFTLLLLSIFCVKNIRAEEDGNLIYVAYDDSGSMLRSTNSNTGESMMADRWCQAKYALEVFSTMLLEKDDMRVYPLNKPDCNYSVSGAADALTRKQLIDSYLVEYGSNTPYATVERAYQELQSVQDGRTKWLLVLTDGAFTEVTTPEANEKLRTYAENGVRVVYLRILDLPDGYGLAQEDKMNGNPEIGFYTYEADKSKDILPMLIEISNLIFKQQALSGYGLLQLVDGKIQITLDMPVEQLLVFAQGEEISLGNLTGNGLDLTAESVIQVSRPDIVIDETMRMLGIDESTVKYAEGLGSVIGSYRQGIIPKGVYQLDVSPTMIDLSTIEVYCKLAVAPDVSVSKDGMQVEYEKPLIEGMYQIDVTLRDPQSGEPLESVLLDPVSYDYKVRAVIDGTEQEIVCNTPQTSVQVQEGDFSIEGVVHVRELTYTLPKQQFTVEKELASMNIECSKGIQIDADTLDKRQNYLQVTVTQNGMPLSQEDWNAVDLTVQGEDDRISYEVEKGSEISTWMIYPLADQEITADIVGEYTLNIHAVLQKGSQIQEANQTVSFDVYLQMPEVSVDVLQTASYQLETLQENSADAVTGKGKDNTLIKPIVLEVLIDGQPITPDEWNALSIKVSMLENDDIKTACKTQEEDGTVHLFIYPYSQIDHPYFVFHDIEDQIVVNTSYLFREKQGDIITMQIPVVIYRPGLWYMLRFWGIVAAAFVGGIFLLILLKGYSWKYKDYRKLWFVCKHIRTVDGNRREHELEDVKGKKTFSSRIIPYRHTKYVFNGFSIAGITLTLLYDGDKYEIVNIKDLANDNIKVAGGTLDGTVKKKLTANSDGGLGQIIIGRMDFGNVDYEEFTLKRK